MSVRPKFVFETQNEYLQAGALDNYRERNYICSGSTLVALMTSETRRPGDLKASNSRVPS